MDPVQLLSPSNPLGNPAPFWFLEVFKVLGFTLHLVPMNLWYAGMILITTIGIFGKGMNKTAANHLANAMPIIVALGINFGIIPLLFTQVAYHKFYYASSILMAWPWISVIALLIFAYYGVYIYAIRIRAGKVTTLARISGWISAIAFIVIGFLFANNMSLMTNVDRWIEIFQSTNAAGAVTGMALNLGEPTLIPRWLMVLGMSFTTVGAYIVFDGAYFSRKESDEFRAFAPKYGLKIYFVGLVIFGAMAMWYFFVAMPKSMYDALMSQQLFVFFFILTAVFPILILPILFLQSKKRTKVLALTLGIAQFLFLGLNAICRQWVQNAEVKRYFDAAEEVVNIQWSPMIVFLILFVIGVTIVIWMVSKAVQASKKEIMV